MKNKPKTGLEYTLSLPVDTRLTVPSLLPDAAEFSAMPPVFATGYMVGVLEWACMRALKPYLEPHERTVGTHINVSHCAATPVGHTVTAHVTLVDVKGRHFVFDVSAHDGDERITEGTHERHLIEYDRFMGKVLRKQGISI